MYSRIAVVMMVASLGTLSVHADSRIELSAEERQLPAHEVAREAWKADNRDKAIAIWRALADEGDSRAALLLGQFSLSGEGMEKDPSRARDYFRQAAKDGINEAQYNLGLLLLDRDTSDPEAARRWFEKAAHDKFPPAQFALARLLDSPHGDREPRPYLALAWMQRAADQGHEKAQKRLDRLKDKTLKPRDDIPDDMTITIQLMSSAELDDIEDFAARYSLKRHAWVKEESGNYQLNLGVFENRERAQTVLDTLPDGVSRHSPWVRTLSST